MQLKKKKIENKTKIGRGDNLFYSLEPDPVSSASIVDPFSVSEKTKKNSIVNIRNVVGWDEKRYKRIFPWCSGGNQQTENKRSRSKQ